MKDKLVYASKYDSVDFQKIFKQNDPRFFIPILKQLGNDSWRFFLSNAATITEVKHYYLTGADLSYKCFSIGVKKNEIKGNSLIKDSYRPSNIECRCDKLIKESEQICKEKDAIIYKGILYGSIETFECSKEMDCPECNGSGKCPTCDGRKEIICPTCDGNKKCPTCHGRQYMTCPECDGTGAIECDNCCGTGKVDCWICDGSGNCPNCNGTGTVECYKCHGYGCGYCNDSGRIPCKTCHGSGECYRCHGRGDFFCQECDGDGEFECHTCDRNHEVVCRTCDGSGYCPECDGRGVINCPTCEATGNCTNCKGSGKITCTRCNGTGYYQTYLSYEIREDEKTYTYTPMINMEDYKKYVKGIIVYDNVFFKSDSGEKIVDELEKVISLFDINKKEFIKWITNIKIENSEMIKGIENRVIVSCIPITKVYYKIKNDTYSFYILGTNNVIAYYNLPPKLKTLTKGIFNF